MHEHTIYLNSDITGTTVVSLSDRCCYDMSKAIIMRDIPTETEQILTNVKY